MAQWGAGLAQRARGSPWIFNDVDREGGYRDGERAGVESGDGGLNVARERVRAVEVRVAEVVSNAAVGQCRVGDARRGSPRCSRPVVWEGSGRANAPPLSRSGSRSRAPWHSDSERSSKPHEVACDRGSRRGSWRKSWSMERDRAGAMLIARPRAPRGRHGGPTAPPSKPAIKAAKRCMSNGLVRCWSKPACFSRASFLS